MNVASLKEGFKIIEDRKRYRLRKEMNTAYKKNTQFQKVSNQSLLHFINQLLEEKNEAPKNLTITAETDEVTQQPIHLPINTLPLLFQIYPKTVTGEQSATHEEEKEPFLNDISPIDIPDRFLKMNITRMNHEPLFGKNIELQIFQRMYNAAVSKYTFHMEMVQNNFRMYEPTFSQIA